MSSWDNWLELAQYVLEHLACPAVNVLSERAFSTIGGFVMKNWVSLTPDDVRSLVNQLWISNEYKAPAADASN